MTKFTAMICAILMISACGTLSPRSRVENSFVEFGVSSERAGCLADQLDERLERDDLTGVADYIDGLNEVESPGEAFDALLRIENPRAVAAIGAAGIACAFSA